jgi:asparagine synthase (glutamine-hydrolysing)
MCGIAVNVDLRGRGRAAPWALGLLQHRGPDGAGTLRSPDGNVVLEHRRLAIIDPDNPEADQPFSDPSGRWTIVYNGEVFNYREIRAGLERRGVRFETESDTEAVLLGFIHEGEPILERLRGMFAFVVWDSKTGDLFAARDQIGVKPFYYSVRDGIFAACSEVRPLLAYPGKAPELDPAGVVEFLAFGNNFGERTLVQDVSRLLPGHCLTVSGGSVRVREYWDALAATEGANGDDPAAELCELLDDAVAASMVSDVPIGLMLSGGVDSSAIAALAARHMPAGEITAYSVAFGRADDETGRAAELARDLGLRLRVVRVHGEDVRADFDSWLADLDYPSGNATWIASAFIARAAERDGIKVLLSGDGGDELFGGYTRWMKYLRFHDQVWSRIPSAGRRALGRIAKPLASGLAGDIARRAATGDGLFVPSRPLHDDVLTRCLGPAGLAAAADAPPEATLEPLRRRYEERAATRDYLGWMSYVALKTTLVEDFLQRLDKMGMRHSVEGRVPLLDAGLARWALATPQRVKVPGFRQKALLREAVSAVLPGYVLERPKQGFCPPVGSWAEQLLTRDRRPRATALLDSGLLDPEAVNAVFSDEKLSFARWTLAILAEWTDRNLTGSPRLEALAAS